jgi:tetratricopeptide (TPR) repeat protein
MKRQRFVFAFIRCLAVLVVIAAPLSVSAQSKKDRERARKLQEQADKAFQQKDYRAAADGYGQAGALVPNNPLLHYRKGFAHFNLKENDLAVGEFTTALSQGHKPLEIYRIRALIYSEQKNYDAAMSDMDKGLAIDPKDLQFLKGKGEIYMDRNAFPAALDAFQNAAKVAPNDADIQYNIARAYFAIGDPKAQGIAAEAALAKGTRFPGEAHYLLGDARQKQGNWRGAIESYQRAINSKPDNYQAYFNLAEVYRNENRFSDSIAALKQAQKPFPNDGKIYTTLSLYYSLAERNDDAVESAKAGITLLPKAYAGYTALCRAQNVLGKYYEAAAACNTALDREPNDGETNYYLGNAYVGLKKSVEATSKYTKAVKGLTEFTAKNPNSADGWYLLGNASFADKQFDQAIDAYLKSLVISPKFLKARVNLGIVYTRKKNKTAALEQYNYVLPNDPALAARLKAEIDKM